MRILEDHIVVYYICVIHIQLTIIIYIFVTCTHFEDCGGMHSDWSDVYITTRVAWNLKSAKYNL